MTSQQRTLTHWDPISDLEWFRSPMRAGRSGEPVHRLWGDESGRLSPAIDIAEDDEQFILTVELPGTRIEDVTVEVHAGTLTIRGEKRNEREERKEHRRSIERSYGTFSRSFTLPSNANDAKVSAAFDAGVLTVTVAKAEEAKPRTVAIKP